MFFLVIFPLHLFFKILYVTCYRIFLKHVWCLLVFLSYLIIFPFRIVHVSYSNIKIDWSNIPLPHSFLRQSMVFKRLTLSLGLIETNFKLVYANWTNIITIYVKIFLTVSMSWTFNQDPTDRTRFFYNNNFTYNIYRSFNL